MPQPSKLDQLIASLDALSPADQDAVVRRLKGMPAAVLEAVVVLTNRGKGEALIADGATEQKLAPRATLKVAIPALPLARVAERPTLPDASGLPTAPKSLVALRVTTDDKGVVELGVDLGGWIANAPRCGWPFAFHRQPEKKSAAWRIETRPSFELAVRKAAPVDLVVIGLGVDLSELAERFALVFEQRPGTKPGAQ